MREEQKKKRIVFVDLTSDTSTDYSESEEESLPEEDRFDIQIHTLCAVVHNIPNVHGDMKVIQLKKRFQELKGVPAELQRLVLAGMELEDMNRLKDYRIGSNTVVHCIIKLRGC